MECSICLNEICGEKESRDWNIRSIKLKCGHCFHKECIESCDKCQICRVEGDFIKLFL